ncbi:MAG: XdhC/CoxI family protein [Anaerolineales bacterium]
MFEHFEKAKDWHEDGQALAIATVIHTWGSSPRPVGSQMVIGSEGGIVGSVSGGCVEGAVVEAACQVIEDGRPRKLHFGVEDEQAWEVGLACGGEIDVFIHPLDGEAIKGWESAQRKSEALCSVLVIEGPDPFVGYECLVLESGERIGDPLGEDWDAQIVESAQQAIQATSSCTARIQAPDPGRESLTCFFHVILPRPTLVAVGGVHIAIPLMSLAKMLHYRTVVIDPRRLFATRDRFPEVDVLLQSWPTKAFEEVGIDDRTAIAMLTHDPKIDDPALKIALRSEAFYVGALGSEKTHAKRRRRLEAMGIQPELIDRLRAPIGLDIGGRSPEEIALSVMAEVVQVRHRSKG